METKDVIYELRTGKGLSQEELAKKVFVTRPLEDGITSREPDGSYNEDYCKWCYAEGAFAYQSKDALLDFLLAHMPNSENIGEAERRAQYDAHLSQLKHWK